MSGNEGVRITLEEWFGEKNISVSDEEIIELKEAIEIAYEMQYAPTRSDDINREDNREVAALKNQIDLLQRFLQDKGFWVVLHDDHLEHRWMENRGDRSVSGGQVFK